MARDSLAKDFQEVTGTLIDKIVYGALVDADGVHGDMHNNNRGEAEGGSNIRDTYHAPGDYYELECCSELYDWLQLSLSPALLLCHWQR